MLCKRCGKEKPQEEMAVDRRRPGGRGVCKQCERNRQKESYHKNPNRQRESSTSYYYRNKNKALESVKKYRETNLKKNTEYLRTLVEFRCVRCGYDKCFNALEFHHTDPKSKKNRHDTMGHWMRALNPGKFKKKIQVEQWVILCANCHREEHTAQPKPGPHILKQFQPLTTIFMRGQNNA